MLPSSRIPTLKSQPCSMPKMRTYKWELIWWRDLHVSYTKIKTPTTVPHPPEHTIEKQDWSDHKNATFALRQLLDNLVNVHITPSLLLVHLDHIILLHLQCLLTKLQCTRPRLDDFYTFGVSSSLILRPSKRKRSEVTGTPTWEKSFSCWSM